MFQKQVPEVWIFFSTFIFSITTKNILKYLWACAHFLETYSSIVYWIIKHATLVDFGGGTYFIEVCKNCLLNDKTRNCGTVSKFFKHKFMIFLFILTINFSITTKNILQYFLACIHFLEAHCIIIYIFVKLATLVEVSNVSKISS